MENGRLAAPWPHRLQTEQRKTFLAARAVESRPTSGRGGPGLAAGARVGGWPINDPAYGGGLACQVPNQTQTSTHLSAANQRRCCWDIRILNLRLGERVSGE